MGTVLRFTREDGTEGQAESASDETSITIRYRKIADIDLAPLSSNATLRELNLSANGMERIDLSPLYSCVNLKMLTLSNNRLRSIDLASLGHCSQFTSLDLSRNDFEIIDLSPLSHCPDLRNLNLSSNQLKEIDLSPLGSCSDLRQLNLHDNRLSSVDLTPLSSCTELERLLLRRNHLDSLEVTPLIPCSEHLGLDFDGNVKAETVLGRNILLALVSSETGDTLRVRKFDAPPSSQSLGAVAHVMLVLKETSPAWKYALLLQGVLAAVGLGWLGMLDNPVDFEMEHILLDTDFNKVEAKVASRAVAHMCRQIDEHGTTLGLDLDTAKHYGELASRLPQVLDLRRDEMQQVAVSVIDGNVDLKRLWLTAYGSEILQAMNMGLELKPDEAAGLDQLQSRIEESGFILTTETCRSRANPASMSRSLAECFLRLVDARVKSVGVSHTA